MTVNIPDSTLAAMAAAALACLVIAVVLLFFFKKKGADVLPFFIGCAVFLIFAAVIEALINFGVSLTPFGKKMQESAPLLAVYGGLMAGLFEETGRFLAFKTVLKRRLGNNMNALQYGAGHGSCEAVLTITVNYISYIVLILIARTGVLEKLFSAENIEALSPIFKAIEDTENWMFGLALLERIVAITLHVALSVLVWFAAKKNEKLWLFPLAILLHAGVDCAAVLCSRQFAFSALATEGVIAALTAIVVIIAVIVWKRNKD